jgi:prepilin-type N-terminal cleavage/methylation domain-containing protein
MTFKHSSDWRQLRGFTLIEVMIVVGIIAILASIALPNYRDYILRGQIVDATTALSTFRGRMEQYFQDNRTYLPVATFVPPCRLPADQRTVGSFVVSCDGNANLTATTFTLSAIGSGSTNGFTFTIDQLGTRATTASPSDWGTCATRWVTKKGERC